jgi:hypothetical protein
MINEFSKFKISAIKRTAQNVSKDVMAKEKLEKKIAELQSELKDTQLRIDAWQTPVKQMTGGYTTEDIIERELVHTGKFDKNGKEIITTRFNLKYPDTVVPPTAKEGFTLDPSVEKPFDKTQTDPVVNNSETETPENTEKVSENPWE